MSQFREVPYIPLFASSELDGQQTPFERLRNRTILPGRYPFWSNNAFYRGITYIDFPNTENDSVRGVSVEIPKRNDTVMLMAWWRLAKEDGSYDPNSKIYKVPSRAIDGSQVAYNVWIESDVVRAIFVRNCIVAPGSGPERLFISFMLFDDDLVVNRNDDAILSEVF